MDAVTWCATKGPRVAAEVSISAQGVGGSARLVVVPCRLARDYEGYRRFKQNQNQRLLKALGITTPSGVKSSREATCDRDGLVNGGNTCYVNAAVQAVAGLTLFGCAFDERGGDLNGCQCRMSNCVLCEQNRQVSMLTASWHRQVSMLTASWHFTRLHRHVTPKESEGSRAYHIERLTSSLRQVAPADFVTWEALDARDALDWLLRSLEMRFVLSQRDIGWKVSTAVVTACASSNCLYRSSSASTPMSMLLLDIPPGARAVSVKDLVKHHFASCLVAWDGCPTCQQSAHVARECRQRVECSVAPPVLVLTAKRQQGDMVSIDFGIDQDGLDLGSLAHVPQPCPAYVLVSVVVYVPPQPDSHDGHFITLSRDSSKHRWRVFDDNTVRTAEASDLARDGAYMFVYLQQGHDSAVPDLCSDDGLGADHVDSHDDDDAHGDADSDAGGGTAGGDANAGERGDANAGASSTLRGDANAGGSSTLRLEHSASSESEHSDTRATDSEADDENMLDSGGEDDDTAGVTAVNGSAQAQPSTECAELAAAAGMRGYSDWNCHEWLIVQVQAALDDPAGLLLQNATLWHATRRNFVYRPEMENSKKDFFSIGDIIAAQIMCAPAHQHILRDVARGAVRPAWSYALPQSSVLFADAPNVVYLHGFNPSRQALEREAGRMDRSLVWRCRCRLASQSDGWMWYFGETSNSGAHRLKQHWVSRSGLLYCALDSFGAPLHSVILWTGTTRKSVEHQRDDRKVAELVMQLSLGGCRETGLVVRARSLNIAPCGWGFVCEHALRSPGVVPKVLWPLVHYEILHSDQHQGRCVRPVPGVHGAQPRTWRVNSVDHSQTTVASLLCDRLDDISEDHNCATIKGLLYSIRSLAAATTIARCDAVEKLAFPFLSAHATQYLPGTHAHTGHRFVRRPAWDCHCAWCHTRFIDGNVLSNRKVFGKHCRRVHPACEPIAKDCVDKSVETWEYGPQKPLTRLTVPKPLPAYRCSLCAPCKRGPLRTAYKMIAHLASRGVFAGDPDIARAGGRRATVLYKAHWLESDRMRASDPEELRDFLRGHATLQPTSSRDIECMWVCRCTTCAGVRARGFKALSKRNYTNHAAVYNFSPDYDGTVLDHPIVSGTGVSITGYGCVCPRCLEMQSYNTTPLGTIALLRHLLCHQFFPVAPLSGVFGDAYCRGKLRRHRYTHTTKPPNGITAT